jgi:hypothetical protein
MSKIPLPLFIFTLVMGRPYPYSFSTNSKPSSSVTRKFPCLGPQNALWIQFDNSLLCFLKASYIYIPCNGNCVMVQLLVTSACFTLPLNTVTEMHWLWLTRFTIWFHSVGSLKGSGCYNIQGDSGGICTTLGNDSMSDSKQKSSYEHGSDF